MKFIQSNTIPDTFLAFTKGQLSYLGDKGFEIIAITSPGDRFEEFRERERIKVYPVVMLREISPFRDVAALFRIIRIMLKERPSLVQGSTPKAGMLTMMAAAITDRPARLFFLRGVRHSELCGWKRRAVYSMEKLTCRLANRVLCTSPSVMKEAIESGIAAPKKTAVLHNGTGNGIDHKRFDPHSFDAKAIRAQWGISDDSSVVLLAGRIVRDKGVVELAECWSVLKKKFPNLYMIMAGSIEKEDPVPQAVLDYLKAEERVIMPGRVKDVAPLYSITDILVHPTYREGIPIAPLEASAMEVPVVATKVTGCVDAVVDGETGILVPPKDSAALAEAIEYLLEHPEERERMGKAGRERVVRDFRQEDVWEALYQEYVRLLIERGVIKSEEEIKARAKEERHDATKA